MSTSDANDGVHHFEGGWTVYVSVPVEEEIGYSGGHTSSSRGFFWDPALSDAEVIAAIDEQRARDLEELSRVRRLQVRVVRDAVDVLLIDEERTLDGPMSELLWPPVVSRDGLVLRCENATTSIESSDGGEVQSGEAPLSTESETLRPWLVEPSGAVRQLPFELAVRPLGAGADGRLLLPCCHPLWWDGEDEAFHWIDLDGETETLLIDGEPVTVSRICTAVGEQFRNGKDDVEGGVFWEPIQGRLVGDELTVRLRGDDDELEPTEDTDPMRVITVSLSLKGPWSVRVIECGLFDSLDVPPPL